MKKYFWITALLLAAGTWSACSSGRKTSQPADGITKTPQFASPVSEQAEEISLPTIESHFLDKDEATSTVYLLVTVYKGKQLLSVEEFTSRFNLNYVVYSDYGSRDRLGFGNVALSTTNVSKSGDHFLVEFDVKKPGNKETGVVLSEISEAGTMKKSLNDLPIRFTKLRTSDRFGIFNAGTGQFVQRHYVTSGEPFIIRSLRAESIPLYVYYYDHAFEPASSPMNTAPRTGSRTMSIDSLFQITSGEPTTFSREGLYYMVTDTSQAEGLGLLVTNDRYPKLTLPELLKGPVQYMSTNQEIKDLQNGDNVKKALDKYWLSLMNGNQDMARQVIRSFYGRVEEANRLFTTYKEGWKTDKGMIFIILGNPDKVQRSKDREVWVYNQRGNANNINFTFNRRNNQFVDDHYELVRYVEYQPIWYPIVEAWRTGAIR